MQRPLLRDGEGAAHEVLVVTPGTGTGTSPFPLLRTQPDRGQSPAAGLLLLGGEAGEEQERWQPGGGGSQGKG